MLLARSVLALSLLVAPAWSQSDMQAISGVDIGASGGLGTSVSVRGDDAFVGAPLDGPGSVSVFARVGDTWSEVQTLDPGGGFLASPRFGTSVALFGELALVGAPNQDGGGAAYLFQRTAGVWDQKQQFVLSEPDADQRFGLSVALSNDLLLVGAPGGEVFGKGAAYVFELSGGAWVQTAKLTASDVAVGAAFGTSVAVEGGLVLIGAPGSGGTGAAYFFSKESGTWTEGQRIEASDAQADGEFGADVSLSLPYALVGAPGTAGGGAAYAFEQGPGGWAQDEKLAGEGTEELGRSVSLVAGALLPAALVGDPERGLFGSTYLYRRELHWVQRAKFTASLAGGFGTDVSAGGGSAMVGAPSTSFGGSVHAFTLVPQDISEAQGIPSFFSNAVGGLQAMFFDTCAGFAGFAYIVLGSASGTSPGSTIGDAFVPLNPDGYFGQTLQGLSPALYIASGAIRSDGLAQAYFFLLPGSLPPSLIGVKLHHSFVVFDQFTGDYLFASEPIPLDLLP